MSGDILPHEALAITGTIITVVIIILLVITNPHGQVTATMSTYGLTLALVFLLNCDDLYPCIPLELIYQQKNMKSQSSTINYMTRRHLYISMLSSMSIMSTSYLYYIYYLYLLYLLYHPHLHPRCSMYAIFSYISL